MSKKDKEEAKGAAPDDASSAPAPERPQGDWPARPEGSTPVQLAQRRTWRRGMFFGALLLLVLLVLLPLLAYGLALGYVKLGFLKSRIDAELAKNFGAGAGLAALDSEGLEALHLESIRLPDAAGQGQDAVTVESADLRWDLWTLATEQRLRSVSLLKPNLILRRDTQGAWNLKLSGGGGSSYVIEQLEARDGTLDLSWAPGRRVKLEALQATLLQPDAPLPVSATLQGRWPSGQAFNGTFTFGPGFAFSTTLNGALELKRDLGEAFPAPEGLEGALTFDLSAHREAGAGEAPTPVTGRVEARGLKLPLGPDLALKLERRALELRGALAWPKDALVPEPRDLEIRLERVGRFGGTPSYEAGGRPALGLRDGTLNVDLAALRALFDPPLLGPEYSAQGTLKLEEVRARVPLDGAWTAAAFEGRLAAEGVRVSVPEFGALPALGLRAKLDYSEGRLQVSGAEVSVENLLSLAGSVSGRVAPPAEPLLELLKGLRLERVELDLGRFAASTLGQELIERRLPRAWLAGGAPPLEALGKLAGQDLKVTSRAEGERTTLRLEGLAAQGLEVVRWPAELNVPQVRFDGDLAAEARFVGGACRAVAVEGGSVRTARPRCRGNWASRPTWTGKGGFARGGSRW
ncbi:MAG: hypothetical protein M5U26_28925 [Planctomycetota bacterium]|nr:hypothetical protein [Planctomycetota bacterium]